MSVARIEVDTITITTAVTGLVIPIGLIPTGTGQLAVHCNFKYGSGGTATNLYLQTSINGGKDWFDILSLGHTTASLRRIVGLNFEVAGALFTASDGSLSLNTKRDGIAGDRLRLKVTTTGTYANTTVDIDIATR